MSGGNKIYEISQTRDRMGVLGTEKAIESVVGVGKQDFEGKYLQKKVCKALDFLHYNCSTTSHKIGIVQH